MPDGSKWDVPAELIAKARAADYARLDTHKTEGEEYEKAYRDELAYSLTDNAELIDYAVGNMDWKDVKEQAVKVADAPEPDFQEGWCNGDMEVVEKEESVC